jgi:acetyl-CoA acetyltransferase family protein
MINGVSKVREVVITHAKRTPFGRANKGSLVNVRPDDMAADLIKKLVEDAGLDKELIEDLLIGCAMTEGEQGLNIARQIGFLADLPVSIGAQTINRFCASSLQTVATAAQAIATGCGDVMIAGGVESMSMVPMGGLHPEKALNPRMIEKAQGKPPAFTMPQTAQYIAEAYDIPKDAQDEYSYWSHMKAAKAQDEGKFNDEIIPWKVNVGGVEKVLDRDECVRRDTSIEKISSLPPIVANFDPNKPPMITAGNSCPTNDGATALIIMSLDKAKELKYEPIAFIRGIAFAGVEPYEMGIGPSRAIPKVLKRCGLKLDDIDIIEINEAFASVVLTNCKLLGLDPKDPRLNPNGGAIAIGHPLGASGGRLVMTAAYELRRRKGRYAIASACVGGGQGMAILLERA